MLSCLQLDFPKSNSDKHQNFICLNHCRKPENISGKNRICGKEKREPSGFASAFLSLNGFRKYYIVLAIIVRLPHSRVWFPV